MTQETYTFHSTAVNQAKEPQVTVKMHRNIKGEWFFESLYRSFSDPKPSIHTHYSTGIFPPEIDKGVLSVLMKDLGG